MDSDAYGDPTLEAQWLAEQRQRLTAYLLDESVPFGAVADDPAWHVAPYLSLWSVAGNKTGGPQWWGIVGDLPADFLPHDSAPTARAAMAAFAERWTRVAAAMLRGERHPTMSVGSQDNQAQLGDLLNRRAESLREIVGDDDNW